MDLYRTYLTEIENRKSEGLQPKPIDDGKLLKEPAGPISQLYRAHEGLRVPYTPQMRIRVREGVFETPHFRPFQSQPL